MRTKMNRMGISNPEVSTAHEELTDSLISEAIHAVENPLSNCCGVPFAQHETDICSECGEHAAAEISDFRFPGNPKEFTATFCPISRELIFFQEVSL